MQMLRKTIMAMSIAGIISCSGGPVFDPSSTPDAGTVIDLAASRSLTISGDSLEVFYTRPIPIILFILSLFMIYRIYKQWKKDTGKQEEKAESLDLS